MDIISDIKNFLISQRFIKESQAIHEEDSLLEDEIIDSLAILELTAFIEEKYGIKIEPHELVPENFDSLRALKDYVNSKQVKL
jgi:acyl carrier protein